MKTPLSPTQSRIAALTALVLAVALVVTPIAWPVLKLHRYYDEAIEDSRDRLSRFQRIIAMRSEIEQLTEEVAKRDAQKYYWKGSTPALIAAEMQSVVTRVVGANNGKIVSSQTLSTKDDGKSAGPAKVSLSVQMTASIIPIQLILHTIESGEPYLFVDQMTIRSHYGRAYKPVPGAQPEFLVQFTVHGYSSPGVPRP